MNNAIPKASRDTVTTRDRGRCQRCGTNGTDWHHRKRRREGGHGAGNGVTLCRTCHSDGVHAQPERARREGYIIPSYVENALIERVPIKTYAGWVLLLEDGSLQGVQNVYDDALEWFHADLLDT